MLRSSKSRRPCGKIRNVVFSFITNRSEVNNHNLIPHFLSLPSQNVINLNISIGDIIFMQILHPMTQLQENNLCYVVKFFCFVLSGNVVKDLFVSFVTLG